MAGRRTRARSGGLHHQPPIHSPAQCGLCGAARAPVAAAARDFILGNTAKFKHDHRLAAAVNGQIRFESRSRRVYTLEPCYKRVLRL